MGLTRDAALTSHCGTDGALDRWVWLRPARRVLVICREKMGGAFEGVVERTRERSVVLPRLQPLQPFPSLSAESTHTLQAGARTRCPPACPCPGRGEEDGGKIGNRIFEGMRKLLSTSTLHAHLQQMTTIVYDEFRLLLAPCPQGVEAMSRRDFLLLPRRLPVAQPVADKSVLYLLSCAHAQCERRGPDYELCCSPGEGQEPRHRSHLGSCET